MNPLLSVGLAAALCPAFASPGSASAYEDARRLLQAFVAAEHGKAFRHLGDERDFDHGHFLFAKGRAEPVAVLYHTQELARYLAGGPFSFLDPDARNWIQWLDGSGRIENASKYLRRSYPDTPLWDDFKNLYLPGYTLNRTIVDKMIDPVLFGFEIESSAQWEFPRADCSKEPSAARIDVPDEGAVCVSLKLK
jgi:hypothetical protein